MGHFNWKISNVFWLHHLGGMGKRMGNCVKAEEEAQENKSTKSCVFQRHQQNASGLNFHLPNSSDPKFEKVVAISNLFVSFIFICSTGGCSSFCGTLIKPLDLPCADFSTQTVFTTEFRSHSGRNVLQYVPVLPITLFRFVFTLPRPQHHTHVNSFVMCQNFAKKRKTNLDFRKCHHFLWNWKWSVISWW